MIAHWMTPERAAKVMEEIELGYASSVRKHELLEALKFMAQRVKVLEAAAVEAPQVSRLLATLQRVEKALEVQQCTR